MEPLGADAQQGAFSRQSYGAAMWRSPNREDDIVAHCDGLTTVPQAPV